MPAASILCIAILAFVAIAAPVVWRGAPLADDFNNCVAPVELGLGGFMATSWHQLGAIRPARFLEILLGAAVCGSAPFGVAILVPLLLTLAVAWLARGLLRDLGTPGAVGECRRRPLAAPAARHRSWACGRQRFTSRWDSPSRW